MNQEKIKRIAVFGNLHRTDMTEQLRQMLEFFQDKEIVILLDEYLHQYIEDNFDRTFKYSEIILDEKIDADLALSIGGDGTFLNSAARIGNQNIPILGINSGRLGFLADIAKENIIKALEDVFAGFYTIEDRTLLHVKALDGTRIDSSFALNDVSILKQDSSSMIIVNAYANKELLNSYQADGLILATPTGSTAYSMSVGGPIVVPQSTNFIISPVASHSLTVRPLIVPDDWVIDLKVESRNNSFLIAIDGRSQILDHNTSLRVQKASYTTKVLKILDHTFFDTLRDKLLWGADVRLK